MGDLIQVNFRIWERQKDLLERRKAKTGRSLHSLVREALDTAFVAYPRLVRHYIGLKARVSALKRSSAQDNAITGEGEPRELMNAVRLFAIDDYGDYLVQVKKWPEEIVATLLSHKQEFIEWLQTSAAEIGEEIESEPDEDGWYSN